MAFDEIQFPVDISYGSRGGPGFKTDVITVDSGAEQRIARWSTPRRSYDVAYGIKSYTQLATVLAFYMARQGALNGFRYKDFSDFTTAANHTGAPANTDCALGIATGAQTAFQLRKAYSDGVKTVYRNITKPVAGSVVVALNGVNQASGWSVNTSTGVVTFSSPPTASTVVTAGCQFDVPVRFGNNVDQLLSISIDTFDTGSLDSIQLIEIKDSLPVYDDFNYGGAFELAISANYTMSYASGRVQVFNPLANGLVVTLPDATGMSPGAPIFYIINEGAYPITIKDATGATVGSVAALKGVEVILSVLADNSTKVWYLL